MTLNHSRTGEFSYKKTVAVSQTIFAPFSPASHHHDTVETKEAKFIKNISERGQPGANKAFPSYAEEGECTLRNSIVEALGPSLSVRKTLGTQSLQFLFSQTIHCLPSLPDLATKQFMPTTLHSFI